VTNELGREPPSSESAPVLEMAEAVRRFGRPRDFRLVFTNGCFDLLHAGHVHGLQAARAMGDRLVVGLNSDASVRRLKGPGRPIVPLEDRSRTLAALRVVDAVVVFDEETPERLIGALSPDVLVKGADYEEREVAGADAVREAGGEVHLLPLLAGRSTSELLRRIGAEGRAARGQGTEGAEAPPERPARLLVATRNPHKLDEIRELLSETSIELLSLSDVDCGPLEEEAGIESGETFAANALAKARYFASRTGLTTLGEDSGLCVDALGGGPGVRTRRFAPTSWARRYGPDEANNLWLLERLRDVPPEERGAHYRCAVAVVDPGAFFVVQGEVYGRIAEAIRGEEGFGYDPLFLLPERGQTLGELPREVKQRVSHRSRAILQVRAWLMGEAVVP
jgi:non-canonical purine NTP pyrophosphatase (RdgB/HAM1 family)